VARRLNLDVPWDLSVIAGTDSARCRLVVPSLTALTRDLHEYGCATAELLLEILAGRPAGDRRLGTPALVVRGSTAPAIR